jgi:hypothetical protein
LSDIEIPFPRRTSILSGAAKNNPRNLSQRPGASKPVLTLYLSKTGIDAFARKCKYRGRPLEDDLGGRRHSRSAAWYSASRALGLLRNVEVSRRVADLTPGGSVALVTGAGRPPWGRSDLQLQRGTEWDRAWEQIPRVLLQGALNSDKSSLERMGIDTRGIVNVGGVTSGQKHFLDCHRNTVLLKSAR